MEYYVFDTEQTAIDAENYISQVAGAPVIGKRLSDNILQPDKQKTTRWAVPMQRITDNKWVFPRLSEQQRSGFSQSVIDNFNSNYPHTIEIYQEGWFIEHLL